MHVITVAFGTAPAVWQFVFKTEEAAKKVWEEHALKSGRISITDDFGQTAVFDTNNITGRMLENMDASKQAHIGRHLHQQRMQAEANKACESDPVIRQMMRGPAVLSPVPGFNGARN